MSSNAFLDAVTLWQARMSANAPDIAVGGGSFVYDLADAFLSSDADTNARIDNALPNMFLNSAVGTYLVNKVQDYGYTPNLGGTATCAQLVFSLPAGQLATSPIYVTAGTLVQTVGDNITTIPVSFSLDTTAVINTGANASAAVSGTCTQPGTAGNVNSGTLTVLQAQPVGYTLSATNPVAATGGTAGDTAAQMRAGALALITTPYNTAAVRKSVLTVPGVYDCYVYDPQDGTGGLTVYWSDIAGATPGGTLGTTTTPQTVEYATMQVIPAAVKAAAVTWTGLTAQTITTIHVHFSANAAIQTSYLTPIIQTAVAAYFQALPAGQAPTDFGLLQAVQQATGYALTNFSVDTGASAPSPDYHSVSTTASTLWRLTGTPSSVVTVART